MKQSGDILPGDEVQLIDENFGGKVVKVRAGYLTFICKDGFEHEYPIEEVVVRDKRSVLNDAIFHVEKEETSPQHSRKGRTQTKKEVPVIDLHLHQLVEQERGLSNHDKLQIQLSAFRKELLSAQQKKCRKIIFIHGIGSGRLRKELERLLRSEKCDFHDASYTEFGGGAIEVILY